MNVNVTCEQHFTVMSSNKNLSTHNLHTDKTLKKSPTVNQIINRIQMCTLMKQLAVSLDSGSEFNSNSMTSNNFANLGHYYSHRHSLVITNSSL
jgi:hypothetical protein